jgi:hypothetical protein
MNDRKQQLPKLEGKMFEIDCIGNYKATADIVFSCFGKKFCFVLYSSSFSQDISK